MAGLRASPAPTGRNRYLLRRPARRALLQKRQHPFAGLLGDEQPGRFLGQSFTVAVEAGASKCEFTVEETGHFQRFVPREIGQIELAAGDNTLTIRPLKKAKAAVMDLRRVILERIDQRGPMRSAEVKEFKARPFSLSDFLPYPETE